MIIYVVQEGDTITSIADKFGVSETRLIQENGITFPNELVIGQTIVITYPENTYIVKEGDSLSSIASEHGISIMQLYRNNSYLWNREYIFPGEMLVISYESKATITTNAYVFPYIDMNNLKRSLPYLTFLSILNYKTLEGGAIESFYDETELIKSAKQFGVVPLMLITSVTFRGERNPEMVQEILLNPDYQVNHAQNMLKVLKEKGYYGLNITITYLDKENEILYLNYLKQLSSILLKEGFPVFITIDPNFEIEEGQTVFEKVDYADYNELIEGAYIMRFFWGTQYGPPMPVSSVYDIELYMNYTLQMMEANKLNIGFPLLGYDWPLPYVQGSTKANAISIERAVDLARFMKATILFDDVSKTPYYEYKIEGAGGTINHIVWFVDARTIYEIVNLTIENGLQGTGLWNIMSFDPQFWLVVNSLCKIEKFLPEI